MKFIIILLLMMNYIVSQSIKIYVDKNLLLEDEFLSLTVEADGVSDFPIVDLRPLYNDFDIVSGPSQQTNFQWINGEMKNTKTLKWTLSPTKTGRILIPALVSKIGKKSYKSNPISINVSTKKENSDKSIFIKADFDKKEAYLGQQISLTYKLYKKNNVTISSIEHIEMPDFKGFWVEDIYNPQRLQYNSKTEIINGIKYQIANLGQKALFPINPDGLIVPEATVKIKIENKQKKSRRDPFFDPFFNQFFTETKTKILKTEQNEIFINPFPDPRPKDFKGAVGDFRITSTIDMETIDINNGLTFTVTLTGSGNIGLFSLPDIKFPDGLEVFPPNDTFTKDVFRNQLTGTQIWEYVIIPRKVGLFLIPSIEMSFFDPKAEKWENLQTKPLQIEVLKSNKNSFDNSGLTKKEVELIGQDIRFIYTDLEESVLDKIGNKKFIIIFYVSSLLIFTLPIIISRISGLDFFDTETIRKRGALRKSVKLLKANGKDPFDIASSSLYIYLKYKLTLPSSNLDPNEVQKILKEKISDDLDYEVVKILNECDAGRFSKEHKFHENLILDKMRKILVRLDEELQ